MITIQQKSSTSPVPEDILLTSTMTDTPAAQPAGQAIPFDQLSSMVDTLLGKLLLLLFGAVVDLP